MGKKIDATMAEMYHSYTRSKSGKNKKISEYEAIELINRAEHISKNTLGNCFCPPNSRKGSVYLKRLLNVKGGHFSQDGQQIIRQYINTGRIPDVTHVDRRVRTIRETNAPVTETTRRTTNRRSEARSNHHRENNISRMETPSRATAPERRVYENSMRTDMGASTRIRTDMGNSRPSITNAPSISNDRAISISPREDIRSSTRVMGGERITSPITTNPEPVENTSPIISSPTVERVNETSGIYGMDWHADKSTWGCHWFPMQETVAGGDSTNNLYSINGPLDKLDKINGGQARVYEYENNRKSLDAGRNFSWWGHCNNASEAACLLREPKHGVTMTAQNGEQIKFTKNDIQGLLVKVVPSLVAKTDFKGQRYNNSASDNPNDPPPHVFLDVIKDWSKDGMPFVLDIDRKEQVWNFPYDQVKVTESDTPPAGANVSHLPNDGSVKYYRIDMQGTGFPEKVRHYECYVRFGSNGKAVESDWIKTPESHYNPDFMWRPHPKGDLNDKSLWVLNSKANNPQVDAQLVYDIYMASLI